MPVNIPFSTQLVLQMSTAVEKMQMQQVLHLAIDQLAEETEARRNEAKRVEIQDPEGSNPSEPTHPDGGAARRGRVSIKKKTGDADKEGQADASADTASGPIAENRTGRNLDVVV